MVSSGALPPGINLGTNGTFSGTPTSLGTFSFGVTVTDSSVPAQTATQSFTIQVAAPLAIATTTLPGGTVGVPYSQQIATSGGILPVSFALTTGAFPTGLSVTQPGSGSQTGTLSGTPTAAGTYTFTETVTDSSNPAQAASLAYTVTIVPAALPPAHVAFLTQPQNTIAGQVIAGSPINILVTDVNNSPLPNVTVNLTRGPSVAPCGTSATYTQTTDSAGIASFANIVAGQGQFGITGIATAGTASAISNSFNVEGFCPTTATPSSTRLGATATLLQNGQVLLVGGQDASGAIVATAEVYDPVAGTLTATGSMHASRQYHTATLLNDGTVLITGGTPVPIQTGSALSSAEIYNPATQTFTLLSTSMNASREFHTATLLNDGTVLLAGGLAGLAGTELNSAEIYDPSAQTFTALSASMTAPREALAATLLPSGQVLLTGGYGSTGASNQSAEIYNPAAKSFTATPPMAFAHAQHTSTLLPNGQVVITGGVSVASLNQGTNPIEVFDPVAGTFTTSSATLSTPRAGHNATLLADGRVLIDGGFNASVSAVNSAEVFGYTGPTSTPTGSMKYIRNLSTATLLQNGTVLVAGGTYSGSGANETVVTLPAEIFYPLTIPTAITFPFTLLPDATQNQPYTQLLLEQGGVGALTWTLTSTSLSLPTGLTLGSNGVLSGTPTQFGGFAFTAQVTDGSVPPKTATFTYALIVLPQFQFFPQQMPTAISGTPYTGNLPLVGGTPPYTSALTAGTLPAGLTFANGAVSGTTTALGSYPLVFQATDSSVPPQSTTATLTLPVTTPLAITTTTLPNGVLGASYSAPIATTGGFGTIFFAPTAGTFPPGLIANAPGIVAGIPTAAGTFTFTLTAVDESFPQQTASQSYTITISTGVAPITLSPNPLSLIANNTGTMTVTLSSAAGPNGQVANLLSSDSTVASVPPSVTVPATTTSATFQVTAGAGSGAATITASATGLTSGTASVITHTLPMALTTPGPLLAVSRSFNATVTLAQPAGSAGVTVTLTANPSSLVSISPASQTIPAGQISAVFALTAGSSAGGVTLTASAPGFSNATAPLTVTTAVISLQTGLVVAPGQSVSMALSLSQAAPPGGLTVSLASSATGNATIAPSVFIPAGAQTPSANPQVTGVLIGPTNITATAVGFAPDSVPVNVTVTASLSPNPVTVISNGGTKTVTLTISAPAPTGGIAFTLLTDSAPTATAPAQVTVIQGATSVQFLVTGVAAGSTTLRADSPGVTEATATVNVNLAPSISIGSLNIGQNLQGPTSIGLGAAAPLGGVTVTVTSSDPTKVLLSQTGKDAGSPTQQFTVGAGAGFVGTLYVYGLQGTGTAQVTASAPGYVSGIATINLEPSGFIINSPGAISTTTLSPATQVQVTTTALTPGTLNYAGNQALRPGVGPFSISLSLANGSVGTLTPATLTFNGGDSFQSSSFQPASTAGSTTLTLGTPPGGFSTPAQFQQIPVTVTLPSIFLSNLSIGNNLQAPTGVSLGATPTSPISVTFTTDPSKLLLSQTGTDAGSSTVVFTNVTSTFVGTLYVYALQGSGTAQITAMAPGYATIMNTVTLEPSGFIINSPGAINTSTFSSATQVQVTTTALTPGTLNYAGNQSLRPGIGPFSISLSLTGGTPGTLTPTTLTFSGGTGIQNSSFQPSSAGNANIVLGTQPAGFSTPSQYQQIPVAVTLSSIFLANLSIGNNLQTPTGVSLGATPPSPISVTFTTDPSKLLLSQTGTDAGSSTVVFTNVTSTFVGTLYVYALQGSGTAQITATAPGYALTTNTVTLEPSGFIINSPGAINTSTFSSATQVQVTTSALTPGTLNYAGNQSLRPGIGPFSISLSLTGGTPGTLTPTTLTFSGGTGIQNSSFQPSSAGNANIVLGTQPAGFSTPSQYQQIPVAVTAPAINVVSSVSVGLNLQVAVGISLQNAPPNPVTLTVTSPNASIAAITADPAVVGGATVTFTNVTSSFVGTFTIQAFSLNTTQLKLQAPGYADAFINVTVNPSGFIVNSPGNFTTGAGSNTNIQITPTMLDPNTLNYAGNQTLRAGLSVNVSVTSSNTAVGTMATSPVVFPGNSTFVNDLFQALASGTTIISVAPPPGFSTPGDFQQIQATVQ